MEAESLLVADSAPDASRIVGEAILVQDADKLFLDITIKVLSFLVYDTGVNIIAGLIGGYAAVYIMNRLGHNKERKKY